MTRVFLNDAKAAGADHAQLAARPFGGTGDGHLITFAERVGQ